jgi:putative sterol carrier protein
LEGYAIAPVASGPPPARVGAGAANGHASPAASRRRLRSLQARAQDRGERAFQAFVARSPDARLERTAGSGRGLRVIFGAMAQQFRPEKANGFAGEIAYELRRSDGRLARWTVAVGPDGATVRPGPAGAPALTLRMAVSDFVRMAGRDLDPGKALLTGRMDLQGDFALALRLGEMFGQPAAL